MDLSGAWRAAPAREELRRTFHEPALDDRDWAEVTVPGHWAHTPDLADECAVLHRHRFSMPSVAEDRRRWITLHGIAQQGDVWLNGAYVGDTDGYFVPHQFEITHLMRGTDEHCLAVDFCNQGRNKLHIRRIRKYRRCISDGIQYRHRRKPDADVFYNIRLQRSLRCLSNQRVGGAVNV